MNHTTHFQLAQWDAADRILREDFNADNARIDAALAEHAAAIAGFGNCQLALTSYQGDGRNGSGHPTLTFSAPPDVVVVTGQSGLLVLRRGSSGAAAVTTNQVYRCGVSWSGSSVTWYSGENDNGWSQLNSNGETCYVAALTARDG